MTGFKWYHFKSIRLFPCWAYFVKARKHFFIHINRKGFFPKIGSKIYYK